MTTTEWTPELVKAALVDAFECDYDTGGRVGPKMYGTTMPRVSGDEGDDEETVRAKRARKAVDVTRMEIVLIGHRDPRGRHLPGWFRYLLDQEGARNCLEAHAMQSVFWSIRGKRFDAKRFCKRAGWNYYTYRSRRDRGASIIAYHLNELGLQPWR